VAGLPAAASGELRVGDKLVSVQEKDSQHGRTMVIGLPRDDVRRALAGEAGSVVTLELLRALDMGHRQAFTVELVRVERPPPRDAEHVVLPPIASAQGAGRAPAPTQRRAGKAKAGAGAGKRAGGLAGRTATLQPSVQVGVSGRDGAVAGHGWAAGLALTGSLAPEDAALREPVRDVMLEESLAQPEAEGPPPEGEDLDALVAAAQRQLKRLKARHVGTELTRQETLQLRRVQAEAAEYERIKADIRAREEMTREDTRRCRLELKRARDAFVDLAKRASGEPLDTSDWCTHPDHGVVHSARQAAVAGTAAVADLVGKGEMIQELRALFRAERAREADAARSAERAFMDMQRASREAEETKVSTEARTRGIRAELEAEGEALRAEAAAMPAALEEELRGLRAAVAERAEEVARVRGRIEDYPRLQDSMLHAIEAARVEAELIKVEQAERLGEGGDFFEARRASVLQRAVNLTAAAKDASAAAGEEEVAFERLEALKAREAQLDARLEAGEAEALGQAAEHARRALRNFRVAAMCAAGGVEPRALREEEARQRADGVADEALAALVRAHVEARADAAPAEEIFVRDLEDAAALRFPFAELTLERREAIAAALAAVFDGVPEAGPDELAAFAAARTAQGEAPAGGFAYEAREPTGRAAGQIRAKLEAERAAEKARRAAGRGRRESQWSEDEDDGLGVKVNAESEDESVFEGSGGEASEESDDASYQGSQGDAEKGRGGDEEGSDRLTDEDEEADQKGKEAEEEEEEGEEGEEEDGEEGEEGEEEDYGE